jgi:WD40 repeat protein
VPGLARDGRRFLSCADDVQLWDTESGECLRVFAGASDTVRSVAWSPDGKQVLAASHDRCVRVWEADTGACVEVLRGHNDCAVRAAGIAGGQGALSCDSRGGLIEWGPAPAAG